MQKMDSAPMRNSQMNPKVPAPEHKGSPGTMPSHQTGHAPGKSIKGFSGGEKSPWVK